MAAWQREETQDPPVVNSHQSFRTQDIPKGVYTETVAKPATNDRVIHGKTETLKQMLHLAKSIHYPLADLLDTALQQKQILTLGFIVHIKKKKILHVRLPGALKQLVRKKKESNAT